MKNLILVFAIVLSVFGCSPSEVTPTKPTTPIVPVVPEFKLDSISPALYGNWIQVATYDLSLYDANKRLLPLTNSIYYVSDFNKAVWLKSKIRISTNPNSFHRYIYVFNKYLRASFTNYGVKGAYGGFEKTEPFYKHEVLDNKFVITDYTVNPVNVQKVDLAIWNPFIKSSVHNCFFVKNDTLYQLGIGLGVNAYLKQ